MIIQKAAHQLLDDSSKDADNGLLEKEVNFFPPSGGSEVHASSEKVPAGWQNHDISILL